MAMPEVSDMAVKYQRLAQEYAKLKAQNQVLKKAVLEAQEDTAKLQTNLLEKEQIIRRSQQEIDSSNFRSLQMSKRIEILQCELDDKSKKSKINDKTNLSLSSVVDEDLKQKIFENEQLHKQLHEFNTEKRQMEQRYLDDISSLKAKTKSLNESIESLHYNHSKVCEQLKNEKSVLQSKLNTLSGESNKMIKEISDKLQGLQSTNNELELKIARLSYVIDEVVVFNDSSLFETSYLRIAPHNKRLKLLAQDLFKQAKTLIDDFCKSLIQFHCCIKKRVCLFPIDSTIQALPESSLKLAQYCEEVEPVIEAVSSAFNVAFEASNVSQQEGVLKLQSFSSCFEKYVLYFSKMLPYHASCIQEEFELSVCVPTLQTKTLDFLNNLKKCLPSLTKLSRYLSCVTLTKFSTNSIDQTKIKSFAYQKVISSFNELHLLFKELSKAFNSKIALESQLPTTSSAPELHTANEFLLGSMLSISSISTKLSGLIQSHLEFISNSITTNKNSVISNIHISNKSVDYLEKVNVSSPPPSVLYDEAIARKQDFQSENSEELIQQLQDVTSRLTSLEREKEHWLLETQLLQVKLEKLQVSENNYDSCTESERKHSDSLSLNPVDTSMLGKIEISSKNIHSKSKNTEDLIKEHLTLRLTEAALKSQSADGKAMHFENECRMLHKHLSILKGKKNDLHLELDANSQRVSQLQDELSVTRRNYEEQLSLMSEHLAAMNDKLATQKDEIDSLKTSTKPSKKSKALRLH